MVEVLTSRSFFDGTTLHGPTRLGLDRGRIVSITECDGDCEHALVSPGFVDLQVNGYCDVDVSAASADDLGRLDDELARAGTTAWLGTLISAPLAAIDASLTHIGAAQRSGAAPGLLGAHLEGPFLGRAPGAHRRDHITDVDLDWLAGLPRSLRMMTLAPECPGAVHATETLVERGVTVSLGHSRPERHQFDACVSRGASMVTHVFNGMSGVHHREGGLALWSLLDDRITVGLIADLVHVLPEIVRLAFAPSGGRRVVLVSDSIGWNTPWAKKAGIRVVDGAPRLPDGTLAGSSSTLAECIRHAVVGAGVPLTMALASATSIPARAIGSPDHGRLYEGGPADLAILNDDLTVVGTRRRLPSGRA